MASTNSKFIIIDGNNLAFRAFYALPPLTNFEGIPCNAIFGFTKMLITIIKEQNPDYVAVCFDAKKKNFRHELFADYKGTRKPTPTELITQMPLIKDLLKTMGIKVLEQEGAEADDLIGTLSRCFNTDNLLVSADKDILQLITNNTFVLFPKKGISEYVIYTPNTLKETFKVTPSQIIDLKALMGDSSDNIPGVAGVGEKTATDLVSKYGTIDDIYYHLDEIKGKLNEKLTNNKEMAYLSKKLATIVCDIPLDFVLDDFKYQFPFSDETKDLFKKYQFNSLLKDNSLFIKGDIEDFDHNKDNGITPTKINHLEELNSTLAEINTKSEISIYLDINNLSLSFDNKEYNLEFSQNLIDGNFNFDEIIPLLKNIFENPNLSKIVFDKKELLHILKPYNIKLLGKIDDILLLRYVVNSSSKSNITLRDVCNENLLSEENYAHNLTLLKNKYLDFIKKMNLEYVYNEIELPLVDVLFSMENEGFKIDVNELENLKEKYTLTINELTDKIHELAGEKFNINSPKQLADILFNKLQLKSFNNKKQSTSVNILNELIGQHDIIPAILQYRQISKLYSTYINAFLNLIDRNTNKIHTIFNQTITSTGRLSSSEPNLQNIPTRSSEGKNIRKVFIPSHKDGCLISADYNQIELRLLASLSGDEILINAYNNNEDIHTRTASEMFNIPKEEVTENLRRDAKAINFGIIYGISEYGLSQNIGISFKKANEYIKTYFARYPKVKEYMQSNVDFCKQNGFVKTIFGRIRNIPEVNSGNFALRSFGERASMNMPLQGSAGDIIKLAMVKVYNSLNEQNLKSKLILQIHDELIIDTYPGEEDKIENILKSCMESIVDLPVKLVISINKGKNWYDAK